MSFGRGEGAHSDLRQHWLTSLTDPTASCVMNRNGATGRTQRLQNCNSLFVWTGINAIIQPKASQFCMALLNTSATCTAGMREIYSINVKKTIKNNDLLRK